MIPIFFMSAINVWLQSKLVWGREREGGGAGREGEGGGKGEREEGGREGSCNAL